MKKTITCSSSVLLLLIFFATDALAQEQSLLLRATTSKAGASTTLANGADAYFMQSSVGQASPIGTYKRDNFILRQGFIQPFSWRKIQNQAADLSELNASVFPNPFQSDLEIRFNEAIAGSVKVALFDVLGKLIFDYTYEESSQASLYYTLGYLKSGKYLIRVSANGKQFTAVLIKNK